MNAPRVGILIASLQAGGAERAALGLLDGLLCAGVDAYLLTLDRNRAMIPIADPERQRMLSERIVRLSRVDIGWPTLAKTLIGPWQWLRLQLAARRLGLDAVVSIVERANIMNLMGLGSRKRVISIRSYPSKLLESKTPLKRWLVVTLYRAFLRRADRIVFVSRETGADFERIFPVSVGKGAVIYNACNLEQIAELARAELPAELAAVFDHPVVLAAGRMHAEKGHWSLVRSFAAVARAVPDARLVLLGDGPLEPGLRRLRDDLGLGDRVVFAGFRPNPLAWIARSRVFVLPSLWEGFPNALLEALAVQVPVVSSDCRSGPRELLAPQSDPESKTQAIEATELGFLVRPPDGRLRPAAEPLTEQEQLQAQAIVRALEDREFRSAQGAAARRCAARFTPDRILPQWARLIRDLVG